MARLNDYAAPAESVDACKLMRPMRNKMETEREREREGKDD